MLTKRRGFHSSVSEKKRRKRKITTFVAKSKMESAQVFHCFGGEENVIIFTVSSPFLRQNFIFHNRKSHPAGMMRPRSNNSSPFLWQNFIFHNRKSHPARMMRPRSNNWSHNIWTEQIRILSCSGPIGILQFLSITLS